MCGTKDEARTGRAKLRLISYDNVRLLPIFKGSNSRIWERAFVRRIGQGS
jgi:hypothetical protein